MLARSGKPKPKPKPKAKAKAKAKPKPKKHRGTEAQRREDAEVRIYRGTKLQRLAMAS
jgi:outer membrane biosynthesis protein TonB